MERILSYHIVRDNVTRRHLTSDYQRLESLCQDAPIHINLYSDGWANVSDGSCCCKRRNLILIVHCFFLWSPAQWYTASGTTITNLDEMASNGVVHIVSSILFPPLGDLYSTVKWTPALQTAFTLLQSLVDEEPDLFTDSSILSSI